MSISAPVVLNTSNHSPSASETAPGFFMISVIIKSPIFGQLTIMVPSQTPHAVYTSFSVSGLPSSQESFISGLSITTPVPSDSPEHVSQPVAKTHSAAVFAAEL